MEALIRYRAAVFVMLASCADKAPPVIAPAPPEVWPPTCENPMASGKPAGSITARNEHACALVDDGTVRCWGGYAPGEITDLVPTTVPEVSCATAVSAGNEHACARFVDGSMGCWGGDEFGELGNQAEGSTKFFERVLEVSDVDTPIAGAFVSGAILSTQQLLVWGRDASTPGVDNGIGAITLVPHPVTGLGSVQSATLTTYRGCAVTGDAAWCWGTNLYGNLGDGTKLDRTTPKAVAGTQGAIQVSAYTEGSACALLVNGQVLCWGANEDGQLGDGTKIERHVPVSVMLKGPAKEVATGFTHACALLRSGEIQCWGDASFGKLGNGVTVGSFPVPQTVHGMTDATSVAVGSQFSCAIRANLEILCWGQEGHLGNGNEPGSPWPVPVSW